MNVPVAMLLCLFIAEAVQFYRRPEREPATLLLLTFALGYYLT